MRYLLSSTLLVVLVCTAVGLGCLATLRGTDARLSGLTARATGELTRTKVACDPVDPRRAAMPTAAVLRTADRAATGTAVAAAGAVAVLGYGGWLLLSRSGLFRGTPRRMVLRRVRLQRGLLTRSWLQTECMPERWIPVHFDPALVTMPSPAELWVYGSPSRGRLVGIETPDGTRLYPSGPVRVREPRGRRSDSPAWPDAAAAGRAAASARLRRRFVADSPRLAVAPALGVLWAFLEGSGFTGWLAATGIVGALGLWLAAVRGSDPT